MVCSKEYISQHIAKRRYGIHHSYVGKVLSDLANFHQIILNNGCGRYGLLHTIPCILAAAIKPAFPVSYIIFHSPGSGLVSFSVALP